MYNETSTKTAASSSKWYPTMYAHHNVAFDILDPFIGPYDMYPYVSTGLTNFTLSLEMYVHACRKLIS